MNVHTADFWRERLRSCGGDLQRAMALYTPDEFSKAHAVQMKSLRAHQLDGNLLDVGCGYGRLLTMLPATWRGSYTGVDISPEFVAIARILHPEHRWHCYDGERLPYADKQFDVAVAVWVCRMLHENGMRELWLRVELEMHRVARKVVVVW